MTNTDENEFKGSLKVKAPDGWMLENNVAEYELQGGETKEISVVVTSKKSRPFNEYLFEYEVCDESGKVIQKIKEMLEFTVIVGTDTEISVESFDGDISDWANAYPVYLNFKTTYEDNVGMPDDPTNKESWHNSQVASRCFFKWDSENLYLLADVYDDKWHQIYSNNSLWLGDSVQLAIDTQNNDGNSYQKDDYEITFSDTIPYAQQVYRGTTGNASKNPVGLCPPEWLKVLRDDKDNITRYLLKLPKDSIDPLKLENGYVFGMNICVNDSDILQRDRFIQITTGIGDGKIPTAYYDFVLRPAYEDEGQMSSLENSTFKIKLDVK